MAVPSILIVAPRGSTNLAMLFGTRPVDSTHFIVTGRVAALLELANAIAIAGVRWLRYLIGFTLVTIGNIIRCVMIMCMTMPTIVAANKYPIFAKLSPRFLSLPSLRTSREKTAKGVSLITHPIIWINISSHSTMISYKFDFLFLEDKRPSATPNTTAKNTTARRSLLAREAKILLEISLWKTPVYMVSLREMLGFGFEFVAK
mmetsp:Transcript_38979/g.39406  ORF Transcript_38979/g.39406 Transcript_38979/m.39406 type:complete len:203 (-) Transcript_38979:684-1292(-)